MKPPARAVVGQLIWSRDGGVWAVWRVDPFAHAHTSTGDKLAVHARLRGMLIGAPAESMLLSVCEQLDRWDVVADMLEGVDEATHPAWSAVCEASAAELAGPAPASAPLLPGRLPPQRQPQLAGPAAGRGRGRVRVVRAAARAGSRPARSTCAPARPGPSRPDSNATSTLTRASTGEIRWLYARALRREINEPALDDSWEPVDRGPGRGSAGVVAHLTGATVKEGGYSGRPRPAPVPPLRAGRHARRHRLPDGAGARRAAAPVHLPRRGRGVALPRRRARLPGRLVRAGPVGPQRRGAVARCGASTGTSSARSTSTTARSPAPRPSWPTPSAPSATSAAELAANPTEPELQATILLAIAAPDLATLEERAGAIRAMFEPEEYGVARPTGGQTGTGALHAARHLAGAGVPGLRPVPAAPGPGRRGARSAGPTSATRTACCSASPSTPAAPAPVLFDPEYGPAVNKSPSLAAVGRLGSGKSFMLKRLCWDTLARGGQVVTIDRTRVGEYVAFAETAPGRVQVVRLDAARRRLRRPPGHVRRRRPGRRSPSGSCPCWPAARPRARKARRSTKRSRPSPPGPAAASATWSTSWPAWARPDPSPTWWPGASPAGSPPTGPGAPAAWRSGRVGPCRSTPT